MKSILPGIALIACLPVFPQDQPATAPRHTFRVARLRTGDGFRFRVVTQEDGRQLDVIAKNIDGKLAGRPEVVRFTGDVEITIDGMKLRADQLDYNWVTGEIEPSGNVRLTPIAP
jgi:hypothetical protein